MSANASPARDVAGRRNQDGFTMVEVIIAIIILAFGLLGMAGSTGLLVRQISLADVAMERTAALQTTVERLKAMPFDSVTTGSDSVGIFAVSWRVTGYTNQWKAVAITTTGPGMAQGPGGFPMLTRSVPATLDYRIIRP